MPIYVPPFPFLLVWVRSGPPPSPSFRRAVPSEHDHMHMQIYSAGALVRASRDFVCVGIPIYVCIYIYPVHIRGPDTPRGACAYSRG